jgi:hypothetical protein
VKCIYVNGATRPMTAEEAEESQERGERTGAEFRAKQVEADEAEQNLRDCLADMSAEATLEEMRATVGKLLVVVRRLCGHGGGT